MFEDEARKRANKLESSQVLGVYDNDEALEYDRGYNCGEVSSYETGFIEGANHGYNVAKQEFKSCAICKYYNMNFLPYWCIKKNEPKKCYEKCPYWEKQVIS